MGFTREQIDQAARTAGLMPEAIERLLAALPADAAAISTTEAVTKPRFDLTHLLWYGGALIVLSAMTLFATLAFAQMGGIALTFVALVYAAIFLFAGNHLWRRGLTTPGGLMVAIAVGMAPMAVFGIQERLDAWSWAGDPGNYRDFYTWVHGSWVPMELATIAAGVVALRFYRFPFIMAVIAFALWFLSMDLAPWVIHSSSPDWDDRRDVSLYFGLALILIAWIVDLSSKGTDFAFWLHVVAALTFWGGLSLRDDGGEFAKLGYCLVNIGLLGLSIYLMRRVYAVFGALGICAYLGYLASDVFRDSLLFPFALSLIGVAVMAIGLWLYPRRQKLSRWVDEALPQGLIGLRPAHARARMP